MIAEEHPSPSLGGLERTAEHEVAILYVDADLRSREAFEADFGRELRVLTTHEAEGALALVRRASPEIGVVVAAERRAERTGFELLQQLGALAPDVGRVLLGSCAEAEAPERGRGFAELDGCYRKPWMHDALARALHGALRRYRLRRRLRLLEPRLREEERLALLGHLADEIGHEFTGPLTAAGLSLDALEHELGLLVEQIDSVAPGSEATALAKPLRRALEAACDAVTAVRQVQQKTCSLRRHRLAVSDLEQTSVRDAVALTRAAFAPRLGRIEVHFGASEPDLQIPGPLPTWLWLLRGLVLHLAASSDGGASASVTIRWAAIEHGAEISLTRGTLGRVAELVREPLPTTRSCAAEPWMGDITLALGEQTVRDLGGELHLEQAANGQGAAIQIRMPAR